MRFQENNTAVKTHATREFSSILITGASSGLGRQLSIEYANPGITLFLLGRDQARLHATKMACESKGAIVKTYSQDVRDAVGIHHVIQEADALSAIDLIMINAGVAAVNLTIEEELASSQEIFETNIWGTFNVLNAIIPLFRARGAGRIAVMSSLLIYGENPFMAANSASKYCIDVYSRALAYRLREDGIIFHLIRPGWIDTELTQRLAAKVRLSFSVSSETAAKRIKTGIEKRKHVINFPKRVYFLFKFIPFLRYTIFKHSLSPFQKKSNLH